MTLESILQQTIANVDHAIIIAHPNGDFMLWNKRAGEILGMETDIKQKDDWQNHFHIFKMDGVKYGNEDLPIMRATRGEICWKERLYISTGVEEGKYLDVDSFPINNGDGSVVAAVASFSDVTMQMKTQKFIEEITSMLDHVKVLIKNSFFQPIDLGVLPAV